MNAITTQTPTNPADPIVPDPLALSVTLARGVGLVAAELASIVALEDERNKSVALSFALTRRRDRLGPGRHRYRLELAGRNVLDGERFTVQGRLEGDERVCRITIEQLAHAPAPASASIEDSPAQRVSSVVLGLLIGACCIALDGVVEPGARWMLGFWIALAVAVALIFLWIVIDDYRSSRALDRAYSGIGPVRPRDAIAELLGQLALPLRRVAYRGSVAT